MRQAHIGLALVLTLGLTSSAFAQDDFAIEDDKTPIVVDDLPAPPTDDIETELSSFEDAEGGGKPTAPRRPSQVETPVAPKAPMPTIDAAVPPPGAPPPPVIPPEAPEIAPAPTETPKVVGDEPRHVPIVHEEERASSISGEKIFDWSKHKGETEVAHPFAEKGLIRIDKDNVYYYKVQEGETRRAADLHAGPFNPYNLANPDDGGQYAYYDENYNGGSPAILANYEWQVWHMALGKVGIRAGGGLFFSQGHGHFVHLDNSVIRPLEVFSFSAFPFSVGAVYRMQWFHRQLFVPYFEGGGTLWAFMETRDDGKAPRFGGSASAYGALGMAFNLTYYDAFSRISLDREYGIHAIYLLAEYRRSQALSPHFDFSADFVNAGLLLEF